MLVIHTIGRKLCQSIDPLIAPGFLGSSRSTLLVMSVHLFQREWRRGMLSQMEKQSHVHPFRTGKDIGCRTLVPGANKLEGIQRVSQDQTRRRLKVCHEGQGDKLTLRRATRRWQVQRNCIWLPRCKAAAPSILIDSSVQTAAEEGGPSRGAITTWTELAGSGSDFSQRVAHIETTFRATVQTSVTSRQALEMAQPRPCPKN